MCPLPCLQSHLPCGLIREVYVDDNNIWKSVTVCFFYWYSDCIMITFCMKMSLISGENSLRKLCESLLCGHRGWNEGDLHIQPYLEAVWQLPGGHVQCKSLSIMSVIIEELWLKTMFLVSVCFKIQVKYCIYVNKSHSNIWLKGLQHNNRP